MTDKPKPMRPVMTRRRDGTKEWISGGKLHREDGPAVLRPDGSKEWRRNGLLHREDGPALEPADGKNEWYLNGLLHRDDGPAVDYAHGYKAWFRHGQRHNDGAPAVQRPGGIEEWWRNGQRHRDDGPAIEGSFGEKEWWVEGRRLGTEEIIAHLQRRLRENNAAARSEMENLQNRLAETQQLAEMTQKSQDALAKGFNLLVRRIDELEKDDCLITKTKPPRLSGKLPPPPA